MVDDTSGMPLARARTGESLSPMTEEALLLSTVGFHRGGPINKLYGPEIMQHVDDQTPAARTARIRLWQSAL